MVCQRQRLGVTVLAMRKPTLGTLQLSERIRLRLWHSLWKGSRPAVGRQLLPQRTCSREWEHFCLTPRRWRPISLLTSMSNPPSRTRTRTRQALLRGEAGRSSVLKAGLALWRADWWERLPLMNSTSTSFAVPGASFMRLWGMAAARPRTIGAPLQARGAKRICSSLLREIGSGSATGRSPEAAAATRTDGCTEQEPPHPPLSHPVPPTPGPRNSPLSAIGGVDAGRGSAAALQSLVELLAGPHPRGRSFIQDKALQLRWICPTPARVTATVKAWCS
mmetsp:Transcript_37690/g.106476  ORF Transcript_37690/g.106476 Transcript_37690/m.106476 type:complete len:277 (+) Transcript_37690:1341-2171(+)